MDIVILGAAMPIGPDTLKFFSLGGSETAQLMLGKELAKLGHRVIQITNLPPAGRPDFIPSGTLASDSVRYVSYEAWQQIICTTPHDLLIISRDMRHAGVPHQAKHAVFWAHDLATYNFMVPALSQLAFNIDEIWSVSDWHGDQIHSITGYPRDRIITMRNGIVDVGDDTVVTPSFGVPFREDKTLIYAARPERGLEALLRPGGIMEQLPDFKLRISMYAHFPEHMRPLYDWCRQRVAELPNVEYLGELTQSQMRDAIAQSSAYVYPTMFEETSCILARECIEQGVPMLTNRVGALPETLGDCGFFLEDFRIEEFENSYKKPSLEWNSDEYCREFANMVRWWHSEPASSYRARVAYAANNRADLYWDQVAVQAVARVGAYETISAFSKAWSMVRDGDVIPAIAYLQYFEQTGELSGEAFFLLDQLRNQYAFIQSPEAMSKHYAMCHDKLAAEDKNFHNDAVDIVPQSPRWQGVAQHLVTLPPGSTVLDFGCAEGVQVLAWAKAFPHLRFHGVDFAEMAISNARAHAATHNATNVTFQMVAEFDGVANNVLYDAVVCTEVLEHQPEPWTLLQRVESYVKPGGKVILTTPFGEWETDQWEQFGRMWNRQHIWQIDSYAYDVMVGNKPDLTTALIPSNTMPDGRARGHLVVSYTADHEPINPIDPMRKALEHYARQTCTGVLISKNAARTIRNTLDSIKSSVQAIRVVIDEATTDRTLQVVQDFAEDNPWLPVTILSGPSIKPGEWGFDDARNLSIDSVSTDWFLWIDSDEYLSRPVTKFYRSNALDSYAIHQHHFSVEPRGAPAQIDRPARLCRTGFRFYGKVHEHAEKGYNQGPGYSMLIPDSDIGHVGYVDEGVRRARFERNFPFLEWDRQVNPDRKLGAYLWFRDILHRMRYAQEAGNSPAVFALANEAIQFYKDCSDQIVAFGAGPQMAVAYITEANRVLGRGRQIDIVVSLDGQPVQYGGVVDDIEQIITPLRKLIAPELEKSNGKYWR